MTGRISRFKGSSTYAQKERGASAKSVCLCTRGREYMYVVNTFALVHLTRPATPMLKPYPVFNFQHADIMSASEFDTFDQIYTSTQSRILNKCGDLII